MNYALSLVRVIMFIIMSLASGNKALADVLPRRGYFGAVIENLTDKHASSKSIANSTDNSGGVLVKIVSPNSPAARAGIQPNDQLLTINQQPIHDSDEFGRMIAKFSATDRIRVKILRSKKSSVIELQVQPFPRETCPTGEVLYQSIKVQRFQVRTIITRPRGKKGPFPAVLLIQGMDCSSIDFGVVNNAPYKKILDALTAQGYVTMRVEKPGAGDSQGPLCRDVDFHLETMAFRNGLRALRQLDFVDRKNIFIFGHSMGGVIAPVIAKKIPVKGIAVFGTGMSNWLEYDLENTRRQLELQHLPLIRIEKEIELRARFLHLLLVKKQTHSQILKSYPIAARYLNNEKYLYGRHYTYFQQLYDLDLPHHWRKVNSALLALWGTSDYVSTAADHQSIVDLVNQKHRGKAKFLAIGGLDHGFQPALTMRHSYIKEFTKEKANPVINILIRWIRSLIHH